MKNLLTLLILVFPLATQACSLTGLTHEIKFSPTKSRLSAEEMRSLAEWHAQNTVRFPNGGKYSIDVSRNVANGVSQRIAERRLAATKGALATLGVSADQLEYILISDHLTSRGISAEIAALVNEAVVILQPSCPYVCCPGPKPISSP